MIKGRWFGELHSQQSNGGHSHAPTDDGDDDDDDDADADADDDDDDDDESSLNHLTQVQQSEGDP